MRRSFRAGAALIGALAVVVGVEAQVNPPKEPRPFRQAVAAEAKLNEETVEKVFKALGPAIREQLRAGREVSLPGVGTLRIVQVGEHRDLIDGRPATIAARNFVEFVGSPETEAAVNGPGVDPARVIEGYEFRINPWSNPGIRTDGFRTPGTRVRDRR